MRHFVVERGSFIADTLVGPGSRITDADLRGAEPGSALIEVDDSGSPLDTADAVRLQNLPSLAPIQVAPIAPHAPNPTQPQAVPGHPPGAAALVAKQQTLYVPAEGVESDEAALARVEQLRFLLAQAEAQAAAIESSRQEGLEAEAPRRRGESAEPSVLDQSVPDLTEALADIDDADELDRLRKAEVGGKSRSGALAAIDARRAELEA